MLKKTLITGIGMIAAASFFTGCAKYDAIVSGNPHVLGSKPVLDSSMYPETTKVGVYEDGSRYIDYQGIRYVGNFEVKKACKDFEVDKSEVKYTSSTGKGTIVIDLTDDKTMLEFTETGVCHLGDIYVVKLSDKKVVEHK